MWKCVSLRYVPYVTPAAGVSIHQSKENQPSHAQIIIVKTRKPDMHETLRPNAIICIQCTVED